MADYALGVPLLLTSLPVMAFCALVIRCVSRGSPFYSQEREGMNGRIIRVWKLRTMYENADEMLSAYLDANPDEQLIWERFFKLKRDPRILPVVGHFLRRTSLDELPQLWNVLKGDMSLVGPRPFPTYHQERFTPKFRSLRCSVLPGLTGLWQIGARSSGDLTVQETLDTYYIRNWSLWMDLHILAHTVRVVFLPNAAC
jgi:lipopolysaccharide/colanic/teichoic acid biosynthesis glycosyltransferase